MRVTMLTGVKNVSLSRSGRSRTVVPSIRVNSSTDDLKFVLIKDGEVSRGVLEMELGSKKRTSRRLRPIEKRLRKLVRAEYRALGRYLVLHEKSSRRRRDGWAKDFGKNLKKVVRRR